MKKLLLLMLISLSCAAQNECGPANGYTGVWKTAFRNGTTQETCTYLSGLKHGTCKTYYLDGSIRSEEEFEFGKLTSTKIRPNHKHDMEDFYTLNPAKKFDYTSLNTNQSNYQKNYTITKEILNDSVTISREYHKNRLYSEQEHMLNRYSRSRIYYSESDNPDPGKNIPKYEQIYYGEVKPIELTHWYNNGNLKSREALLDGKPVGTHYLYYNTYTNNPETVTHYSAPVNDDETYSDKASTRKITKYFDASGNFIRYTIDYGATTKEVTLKDSSFGHLWSDGAASGIIDHGRYRIDSVKTEKGIRVKAGNGKSNVYPVDFIIGNYGKLPDTVNIPAGKGTYEQWRLSRHDLILPVDRKDMFLYGSESNSVNLPFEIPKGTWKGKIKDGYLTGPWEIRGEIDYKDYKTGISFKGHYEKGLKQGLWKVETDLYEYTINYINDKKEGELKITLKPGYQYKLDKGFKDYYAHDQPLNSSSSPPKLYRNALSLVTGTFKNDEMDGEWIHYYRYPDLMAGKLLFDNGELIAKQEAYTPRQQLIVKREIKDRKIISEKHFTPLGEEFDMKQASIWWEQGEIIRLDERLLNSNHARSLVWNIYTGEIFHSGTYDHGLKTGTWVNYSSSDTIIKTYRNDTLDGYYYESYYYGPLNASENKGYYAKGKKSGTWHYSDRVKKLYTQRIFMDDEEFLISHKERDKTYISEGKGSLFKYNASISANVEEQFENGRKVKTIMTSSYNNQITAIIYHITNKDSLAYYMPPKTGTCVKNGEGMLTHYGPKKMIDRLEYYEKGSLVKIEAYDEGQILDVFYSHYVNDTSTSIVNRPFLERVIAKPFGDDVGMYTVSLILKNLPKNTTSVTISNGETNFKSGDITIANSNNYPIQYDANDNHSIHYTTTSSSLSVELRYPQAGYNVMKQIYRVVVHTADNKTVNLIAGYPLRTLKNRSSR